MVGLDKSNILEGLQSRLRISFQLHDAARTVYTDLPGGWAAGPALNIAGSSLFRAAVLTVPTLDVLTSLLEDATYGPYELGNPRADVAVYQALRWSPYEGLLRYDAVGGDSDDYKATDGLVGYPALLLRIGLFDTNVPYWDPAKYMARLRSLAARDAGVGTDLRVMQVRVKQAWCGAQAQRAGRVEITKGADFLLQIVGGNRARWVCGCLLYGL